MISHRVGTVEKQRPNRAVHQPLEYPGRSLPKAGRERSPRRLESFPIFFARHRHPSREQTRGKAHVEGPEDIATPHQGKDLRPRNFSSEGGDGLGQQRILGEPGAPDQRNHRSLGQRGSGTLELLLSPRLQPAQRLCAGANPIGEPVRSNVVEAGASRVDDDKFGSEPGRSSAHPQIEDWELLLEVGTPQQNRGGLVDVADRRPWRHRGGELGCKAIVELGIEMRGDHDRPQELPKRIGVFVGGAGTSETGDFRSLVLGEPVGNKPYGLFPRCLAEPGLVTDERGRDPLRRG